MQAYRRTFRTRLTLSVIGLALVPQVTRLGRALNAFLSTHQQDLVGFFKGAAEFAGQFGAAPSADGHARSAAAGRPERGGLHQRPV